jgi:hypothetical protein
MGQVKKVSAWAAATIVGLLSGVVIVMSGTGLGF